MPKSINLGNGSLLIGLNNFGLVKDLYYEYPGLENHIGKDQVHKIGVFVDNSFSWIDSGDWNINVTCEETTLAGIVTASSEQFGITIVLNDIVYNEDPIFIRQIRVINSFDRVREIRLFFNQQFTISQSQTGDTAYYDPIDNVVIHYRGRRVFLANSRNDSEGITSYCVGLYGIEGKAGTFIDAEDGNLSENAVEHGHVDSVIQKNIQIDSKSEVNLNYWIIVSDSIDKAKRLNELVINRTPRDIATTTKNYWSAWVNLQKFSYYGLSDNATLLFKRSLLYMKTHVSDNGAIIASGDSDMLQFGRDTYAYVWPRDAAFAALALERSGDTNASRKFFEFCNDIVSEKGFFMHKYRPDKALGSSWHPWIRNGKKQFPIQEDETALVLFFLWKHFELSKDIEFIEGIYNSFIKKTAEFLASYIDEHTGLPAPSYDLWEQDYGISTFTASTVYGALIAASKFAELLGKEASAHRYSDIAEMIKRGILKYLYDENTGGFIKMLKFNENEIVKDTTLDASSAYGVFRFGVLSIDDDRLRQAMGYTKDKLWVSEGIGGIARFSGDTYHHKGGDYPGNPWVITTMWYAQYLVSCAKNENDLDEVKSLIEWCVMYASSAGTLPEQFDPHSGNHLSASPLVWSHAEYVTTIIEYLRKIESLGISSACYPLD
jgi:GH15 family glucan-1,4-alpha-glucosidase